MTGNGTARYGLPPGQSGGHCADQDVPFSDKLAVTLSARAKGLPVAFLPAPELSTLILALLECVEDRRSSAERDALIRWARSLEGAVVQIAVVPWRVALDVVLPSQVEELLAQLGRREVPAARDETRVVEVWDRCQWPPYRATLSRGGR